MPAAACCCWCLLPLLLCTAGLQYFRDATSWLSETHVRFGVGVSVDLIKRINELHDLVGGAAPGLGLG